MSRTRKIEDKKRQFLKDLPTRACFTEISPLTEFFSGSPAFLADLIVVKDRWGRNVCFERITISDPGLGRDSPEAYGLTPKGQKNLKGETENV